MDVLRPFRRLLATYRKYLRCIEKCIELFRVMRRDLESASNMTTPKPSMAGSGGHTCCRSEAAELVFH